MVLAIKLADKYLGGLLCRILGIFSRKKIIGETKKILVIQLWGIGETVLVLPSIEALRKKYPQATIDILATKRNNEVFFNNKHADNILTIETGPSSLLKFIIKNFKKYDLVIDMEEYLNISAILSFFTGKSAIGYSNGARSKLYNIRIRYNDQQHASETFLDLIRALDNIPKIKSLQIIHYSKKDKNNVDNFLKINGIGKKDFLVCVAPGAAESAKSRIWPLERYAELCDEIISKHNAKIIFVGTSDENQLVETIIKGIEKKTSAINSTGKITLKELFYLIEKSKLFIGNDSGPMHIAAAQGTKTLGLFGPNIPLRFGPIGKGNIGLYKGYNCEFSPCINVHKGQVPDCMYPKNSNDYQKCMKNISVDDALKEVEKLI
ncbi:MAG TPA: glycosyltransferase family 9 protein [Candidatus Nanoarchaeia archaeon]|nr:glycosyltransferase family 9 protein [Candidatus Nanoarchaeia archaeon]